MNYGVKSLAVPLFRLSHEPSELAANGLAIDVQLRALDFIERDPRFIKVVIHKDPRHRLRVKIDFALVLFGFGFRECVFNLVALRIDLMERSRQF